MRSFTGQRYQDEVLKSCERLFKGAYKFGFLFMYDNESLYGTNLVNEFIESEDVELISWPTNSPDLNRIQNLWDYLGREIARRYPPSRNLNALKATLLKNKDNSQTMVNNIIGSI